MDSKIMNTDKVSFVKTDKNILINEMCIRWIEKMDECLEVCIKTDGCIKQFDTHKICKSHSPDSYEKLNSKF